MIRKILAILDCFFIGVCFLSYHIISNAYISSVFNDNHGYVYFFGMRAYGGFFIDIILWVSIFLIAFLMFLILLSKE